MEAQPQAQLLVMAEPSDHVMGAYGRTFEDAEAGPGWDEAPEANLPPRFNAAPQAYMEAQAPHEELNDAHLGPEPLPEPRGPVAAVLESDDLLRTLLGSLCLSIPDLLRATCVSHQWRRVLEDPSFWRRLVLLERRVAADQVRWQVRQIGSLVQTFTDLRT
jgi:hypothetical protein